MRGDAAVAAALRPAALGAVLAPGLFAAFVAWQAWQALREVGLLRFFTDPDWAPTSGRYDVLPMIAGTLVSSVAALLWVAPVALAWALHTNLFAGPRVATIGRAAVGLLAGIPSVVFGLVALTTLVPRLVFAHPPGLGLGVTTVTLGVMILPTAAAALDAAVRQVDPDGVRATLALGLGRWDAVRAWVLPHAAPGIRAGLLLALGRAVGETMAVLMVAGNTVAWPTGPFATFRTLTGNVAVEMSYAVGVHRSALFVTALLLFGIVAALVAARRSAA